MELSVQNRLILLSILPKEGDITTLKILRDLQSNLSFTEEETKILKFRNVEGQGTHWDPEGSEHLSKVDIQIGNKANAMIVSAFQKLSEEKKLTIEHLDTFERFVTD